VIVKLTTMLIILFLLHPQPDFSSDPKNAIRKAYLFTDEKILENSRVGKRWLHCCYCHLNRQ
jgi:hypothetical protein